MIKRKLFVLFGIVGWMFLVHSYCYAQFDEKALKEKLDSTIGNERIMILNRLSDGILYKSPQQSLKYGIEALNLSKKDSNLQMLGESYLSVAYALRYMGEYKKALDSLYITIEFINELKDKKLQSQILNLIGLIHQSLGHDTLSLENYFKSFDLAQEVNDNFSMISVLNNLGNFYMNAGNYKKSTEYFFKCLTIYERTNNEKGMAQIYNNIGTVFQKQGNYYKALEYHLKAYEIIQKYPDYKIGFAYVYNNLGACYINTKEYDKAAEFLLKSTAICKEIGLQEYLLANYNNLGIVFKEKKEFRKAIDYLLDGLKLADKIQNNTSTSKYLLNIADVYLIEKKYDKALSYFNRAMHYNNELQDYYLLSENNYGIYEVYKATGNYHESLKYLEKYLIYRDSLDVINNSRLVAETEAQYELEKKEQRIGTLQKDSRIQILEIEKEQINNKILLFGLSGLIFIITLITYLFVQRIKMNNKLKEQNRQINDQNEELYYINERLIKSEKELIRSNNTKDKFFSIIAHDLKNPLIALKSYIFNLNQQKNTLSQQDFFEKTNLLEGSLNSIMNLLNNLLLWARSQKHQIAFTKERIDIYEIVENCIKSLDKLAKEKNIKIENHIDKNLNQIYSDKNMFDFIVRNILSNAIKFSYLDSLIEISYSINEHFILIIRDYGIGISKENQELLFNEEYYFSTQGTNNETGTGLGLVLCNEFVRKMNGSIEIESNAGEGSIFKIKLPFLPV